MKKYIILLSVVLSSCAYGPRQEKKSALNYLNGEHYDQAASLNTIPIMGQQKAKETIITGKIVMEDSFTRLPNNLELILTRNGQTLLTSSTNAAGNFSLQGNLPNGDYLLKANSSKYKGELLIKVEDYKVSETLIVLHQVH